MDELAPHLHGDVGYKDQQAERLDALSQAAGRLPGGRAVAHVRGARERGRGLDEGQSQDQENGEAQNPGKGTETGQKARTSHARGPESSPAGGMPGKRQGRDSTGPKAGAHTSCSGATRVCVVRPHTPGPNSGATAGRKILERSPHHRGALSASAPVRREDSGSSSTPGRGACLPPESPPGPAAGAPWGACPLTTGCCWSSTTCRATETGRPCGG